jgi:hypothetical protein
VKLRRRLWQNVLLSGLSGLSGLVLLLAACGSGGAPASGTAASSPSPSAAAASASDSASLCSDVAALRESLQKLGAVRPGAADQLRTAAQDAQADLLRLSSAAGSQWPAQIHNLRSALARLEAAAAALAADRNSSTVSAAVYSAINGVKSASHQLLDAASSTCPSASPSPSG